MQFVQDPGDATYIIKSYQPGQLIISELILTKSAIVTPEQLIDDWPPQSIKELSSEHMDIILTIPTDVVLLGTGETQVFPDLSILSTAIKRGIAVEIMDTSAACRTYNILMSEGRDVTAALIV